MGGAIASGRDDHENTTRMLQSTNARERLRTNPARRRLRNRPRERPPLPPCTRRPACRFGRVLHPRREHNLARRHKAPTRSSSPHTRSPSTATSKEAHGGSSSGQSPEHHSSNRASRRADARLDASLGPVTDSWDAFAPPAGIAGAEARRSSSRAVRHVAAVRKRCIEFRSLRPPPARLEARLGSRCRKRVPTVDRRPTPRLETRARSNLVALGTAAHPRSPAFLPTRCEETELRAPAHKRPRPPSKLPTRVSMRPDSANGVKALAGHPRFCSRPSVTRSPLGHSVPLHGP